jgi:hypothetical protein
VKTGPVFLVLMLWQIVFASLVNVRWQTLACFAVFLRLGTETERSRFSLRRCGLGSQRGAHYTPTLARPGGVVPFSRAYTHTPSCVDGVGYKAGKSDTPSGDRLLQPEVGKHCQKKEKAFAVSPRLHSEQPTLRVFVMEGENDFFGNKHSIFVLGRLG